MDEPKVSARDRYHIAQMHQACNAHKTGNYSLLTSAKQPLVFEKFALSR